MSMRRPITERGQRTRATIVGAAAELMDERGVRATSLDDVLESAGAGKSQLYHYFATKDELAAAVLEHQLALVLGSAAEHRLDTWTGLRAWFDVLVSGQQRRDYRGCPVGSLSVEMSALSEELADRVAVAFARWQEALSEPLQRMKHRGALGRAARPRDLAAATLVVVQGGYLLSSAARDPTPMRQAVDLAYRNLRAHRAAPPGPT